MNWTYFFEGVLNWVFIIVFAFVVGYAVAKYQEHRLVADCPQIAGKVAETITVTPSGEVRCVYVRPEKWQARWVAKGSLK